MGNVKVIKQSVSTNFAVKCVAFWLGIRETRGLNFDSYMSVLLTNVLNDFLQSL